jgi:hypothetical protein
MHFPMDVVGGWVAGAAVLWALWRWQAPVTVWLKGLGLPRQILVAVLVSGAYAALAAGTLAALGGTSDPAAWPANAALTQAEPIVPRDPESVANAAGMLLGLGVGLALAERWARFDASGPWGKRAVRFLIGVVGILLCWRGLALIFPTEPLPVALAFRYVRYALIVAWALFGAPWVFVKLGLASPEAPSLGQTVDHTPYTGPARPHGSRL